MPPPPPSAWSPPDAPWLLTYTVVPIEQLLQDGCLPHRRLAAHHHLTALPHVHLLPHSGIMAAALPVLWQQVIR